MNELKEASENVFEPIVIPADNRKAYIAEMLSSLPLFQDLDRKQADQLAMFLKPCRVREDTVIFEEGDEGTFMGIIFEGLAEVSKQNSEQAPVKIGAEGTGRIVGEMALLDTEPRSATARFVRSGVILLLSKESFDRILAQYPQLGVSILLRLCRVLSQRLRRTSGVLSDYLRIRADR